VGRAGYQHAGPACGEIREGGEQSLSGIEGPAYAVFDDQLSRNNMPILVGILRMASSPGSPSSGSTTGASAKARDEILVEALLRARKTFRGKALVNGVFVSKTANRDRPAGGRATASGSLTPAPGQTPTAG
jgi:hypothetical protein